MQEKAIDYSLDPNRLLADLDQNQYQVATHQKGPLCVLAGAGTGKTRAITYRIAYGVHSAMVDLNHILALTFTQKAAGELRSRLQILGVPGVSARTFHSAAMAQVRTFWPQVVGGQMFQVTSSKASLVAGACARMGMKLEKNAIRDIASEIEWAKVSLVDAQNYAQKAVLHGRQGVGGLEVNKIAQLIELYESVKRERQVIDFEDLLLINSAMIDEYPQIAQAVRKRYRYFVVDEFQDVSPLQYYLLQRWMGKSEDLCVVGDWAQTIYSFAGASSKFLLDFPRYWPQATVVKLEDDYRSTTEIVSLANQILAKATYQDTARELRIFLRSRVGPGPKIQYFQAECDVSESQEIARRIQKYLDEGIQSGDIAILYRTNAQSSQYEQALQEAGISYTNNGDKPFFEREEIKKAVLQIKTQSRNGEDRDTDLGNIMRNAVSLLGWRPTRPAGQGAQVQQWENLQVLVDMAEEMKAKNQNLTDFINYLQARMQRNDNPQTQAVTLTTLHASKGLEWPVVFLTGLSDGLMPISAVKTDEGLEEERRLLYVGVTRAKTHLIMSYAKARRSGSAQNRRHCRFLNGIWPATREPDSLKTAISSGGNSSKTRRKKQTEFYAISNAQQIARFEALRAWRAKIAKETSRPAFTVFSDATLQSVAQVNPRTLKALRIIRGVGEVKLEQFGAQILQVLRESGETKG